ncbi:hypothetical protein CKK34_5279 [Yarrowia sp. E02]|nr:hypothetical protein CKK34_5279 [Yarrowia sp. E02]
MPPKRKPQIIYDTGDTGTPKQRKDQINAVYTAFAAVESAMVRSFNELNNNFQKAVASLAPPLPTPSSKEVCKAAVDALMQKHALLVQEYQPKRQQTRQMWGQLLDNAAAIEATYNRLARDGIYIGNIGKGNLRHLDDLDLTHKHLFDETQGPRDHILLQEQIQKMLDL